MKKTENKHIHREIHIIMDGEFGRQANIDCHILEDGKEKTEWSVTQTMFTATVLLDLASNLLTDVNNQIIREISIKEPINGNL